MSNSTILDVIEHYQKSIDRSADDEQRLLHCINKLYKLPVKVEHLQQTGIGKTINSLRKYNGEIGVAAKALVAKWKAMVAAEEISLQPHCNNNGYDSNNSNHERESSDDNKNSSSRSISNSQSTNKSNGNNNQKVEKPNTSHKTERSHHNEKHSSSKHKSISSSHSKEKKERINKDIKNEKSEKNDQNRHHENERGHRKQIFESEEKKKKNTEKTIDQNSKSYTHKHISSSDKSNKDNTRKSRNQPSSPKAETESDHTETVKLDKEKNNPSNSSKSTKHHSDKKIKSDKHHKDETSPGKERNGHSSSSKHSSKKPNSKEIKASNSETSKHKRHHNTDNEEIDVKQPKLKIAKTEHQNNSGDDDDTDGFDSSMGANFADVLGMLNVPTVKTKKSNNCMKASLSSSNTLNKTSTEKSSQKRREHNLIETKKPKSSTSTSAATAAGSKSTLNKKPDLLSSCAKLEPLDPNIALELPTTSISTNYKPMPLNQTVMDCVFKTSNSSASKAQANYALSEAEAISHGISSKTMRTKIYSGVRTGQIFQVPTLFDLCIRILQKHIDALEYTGGVPFEVLRPVLERASPQQLLVFEDFNPYLMEDTDILWQQHCQRNYRLQKRQEMETWREMYLRCQEDQERKLNILAESIKQSQKIIAAPIRKTQLAFVDSMVKPPRNIQRKQEQYGTKSKLTATPASRVAALSSVTPNAAKSGDTRLRIAAGIRDTAQVSSGIARPKKAPLMAKTLQFMRGRLKR